MIEMSEDELDAIRKKYLSQMQPEKSESAQNEQVEAQKQAQLEAWKQGILRKILSEPARTRLANLKLVKPDRAAVVENHLIQLHQARRITAPLNEEQLLQILRQLNNQKRDSKIEFRRS